jgi:hypothetical protein
MEWLNSAGEWQAVLAIGVILLGGLMWLIRNEIAKRPRDDNAAAELVADHGKTLRDAVDRIEHAQLELHTDIRTIAANLQRHLEHHLNAHGGKDA